MGQVDLDSRFTALVGALERDLARLDEGIARYRAAYEQEAEATRAGGEPARVERARRALQRLQQVGAVRERLATAMAYLQGTAEVPGQQDEAHELAARILDGLEVERQRLYRDVHDGPAQVLTNAIFEIEFFERVADRAPADVRAQILSELANLRAQFRAALESIRATIFDLRPPALAQLGLTEAMRAYAAEWQSRYGLRVETDLRAGPTGLLPEQELSIYRVLQETLQNVQRHASARVVRIAWQRREGRWWLEVGDDGVGFDAAAVGTRTFGLLTMRERAEVIGGTLQVRSAPGQGTSVTLSVPSAA